MSDDLGQPSGGAAQPSSGRSVQAYRGTAPVGAAEMRVRGELSIQRGGSAQRIEGPATRDDPFAEDSPGWAVAQPRTLRGASDFTPLVPGGLYVGAEGSDAAGLHYRLVAPLDRGGMGELFVAQVTGPQVSAYAVVKRLLPELMDDPDYVQMFRSEAEVMAQLDHPSVVRVLGMPVLEDAPCLALEFVDGRSVQQLVSRARRLKLTVPAPIAAFIARRVAEALDHVHHARATDGTPLDLVHRDVSPGNVLIGFDGAVKLTDFGIAKSRMSAVSTTVGIVKGKARYLAPEQILGKNATPRSDLFSNALVLVEMLTGKPLFERGSIPKTLYAIVHGERERMSELLPAPAKPLAPLLESALSINPLERLATARAFAEELAELADELGPSVDAPILGHHLRGLFTGTKGPLTQAVAVPSVGLPKTGSAPLDPQAFGESWSLLDDSRTPLPLLDPVEAEAPRSAPNEVDQALSVLAWLQARDASVPEEARTLMAVSPPPPRPPRAGLLFGAGLAFGILATAALLILLEEPTTRREASAVPEPSEVEIEAPKAPEGSVFRLEPLAVDLFVGPPRPPPPPPPPEPLPPARLVIIHPRGARVFIDGHRLRGRVPLRDIEVEPGAHEVTVRSRRSKRVFDVRVEADERLTIGRNNVRRSLEASTKEKADERAK